jgi:D-tyrosyl-tRNA(Tyr) deacylase
MEYELMVLFGIGFKQNSEPILEEDIPTIFEKYLPILNKLSDKIINLRVFDDEQGKMNFSVKDIQGGVYIISQFTLFGNYQKGNKPSFYLSANSIIAEPLINKFIDLLKIKLNKISILTGKFDSEMKVTFCNDGPVTLFIEASLQGII